MGKLKFIVPSFLSTQGGPRHSDVDLLLRRLNSQRKKKKKKLTKEARPDPGPVNICPVFEPCGLWQGEPGDGRFGTERMARKGFFSVTNHIISTMFHSLNPASRIYVFETTSVNTTLNHTVRDTGTPSFVSRLTKSSNEFRRSDPSPSLSLV